MKRCKKILTAILAIAVIGSLTAFTTDKTDYTQVADKVLSEVTHLYTNYYTISNAYASVVDATTADDGSTAVTVFTSFDRTLITPTADELPYIQGLEAALAKMTEPSEIASAQAYLDAVKHDMNDNYIGKAQSTEAEFIVMFPGVMTRAAITDINISSISFVGMADVIPAANLTPDNAETLRAEGEEAMETVVKSASMFNVRSNLAIQNYDRVVARDYARNWSCTGGNLYDHKSCHNPDYSFHDTVDCANFVSQSIRAGGLDPDDPIWEKDTDAWVGVYELKEFMTDNDFFFQTTSARKAIAGSIINWIDGNSHVGLVDQNDTVTMTFCAHTKCRRSCPWEGELVDFYVPRWDSYNGVWVQ